MYGPHHLCVWGGGGLEEAVDSGIWGGALILPFIDFPSRVKSSELEARVAGGSPAIGSEEAAMLPSGCERGSSTSKRRGEVDGGGGGGKVQGWRKRTFSRLLATHLPLPSILRDGDGDSDGAIRIDDVQRFLAEYILQRCQNDMIP